MTELFSWYFECYKIFGFVMTHLHVIGWMCIWQSVYSLAGRIRIDWTKWSIITNYVANTHVWKIYFNEPFFIVVNQLICALSVKSCIGYCDLCNEYDWIWLELIFENASVAVLFRCLCPYPRYAEQFTGKFWAMTTKHYPSFLFYSRKNLF